MLEADSFGFEMSIVFCFGLNEYENKFFKGLQSGLDFYWYSLLTGIVCILLQFLEFLCYFLLFIVILDTDTYVF